MVNSNQLQEPQEILKIQRPIIYFQIWPIIALKNHYIRKDRNHINFKFSTFKITLCNGHFDTIFMFFLGFINFLSKKVKNNVDEETEFKQNVYQHPGAIVGVFSPVEELLELILDREAHCCEIGESENTYEG